MTCIRVTHEVFSLPAIVVIVALLAIQVGLGSILALTARYATRLRRRLTVSEGMDIRQDAKLR